MMLRQDPRATLPFLAAVIALVAVVLITGPAHGAENTPDANEIEQIKNRYWAQGNENEMGVVQNRLYTKRGKTETWFFGGLMSSDPFLTVRTLGFQSAYHFNESFSLGAFGMRNWTSPSAALDVLELGGKKANTNPPRGTVGSELQASLLYGKLSLLGASILYYDMHAGAGFAVTSTETGTYAGPSFSIGQNIYLNKRVSLRFDYRMIAYRENIVEKEITAKLGQVVGARNNFSNSFQFGVSFLWGAGK